jgi:hypothetical protein
VRLLFFVYVVRGFSNVCAWFLLDFVGVDGCGMDGWFLLVLMTIFAFRSGFLLVWAGEVFYLLSAI